MSDTDFMRRRWDRAFETLHNRKEPSMTDTELRIEALRLAVAAGVPDLRDQFYAFLTGKGDQTPREVIDAALEAANVR